MPPITPRGSINAPVWVIVEQPYSQDKDKGYVFSAGYGYVFDRMMQDAGISDYYVIARRNDFEHLDTYTVIESALNNFRPPIIIPLGNSLGFFNPEVKKRAAKGKTQDEQDADMEKYAGSLMTCPKLINYPHYIISTMPPDVLVRKWELRDICVNLDLGKAKSELDFYRKNGYLEPLPEYQLQYNFEEPGRFPELLDRLRFYETQNKISTDIETVYPKAPTKKSIHSLYPHPGLPTVIGLSHNSREGISFKLFRDDPREAVLLWRQLNSLFSKVELLGQNFFDFDASRLNMLGFDIPYEKITDTMIRQHILWPELPKKLQFLTRQYTRQPYYKDEGQGWSVKDFNKLKRYNCLDVCVTMEVYNAQEGEFAERPYLR